VKPRSLPSLLIAAAATAAVLWAYGSLGRHPAPPVPIQDAATIDFSGGSPRVATGAADKAALEAGVKAIDDATRDMTIPANPPPK
jgi:hypothetical protein